jgi:hypothetical protein
MKNGDSYGSPFFIAVICAPIGVFCVPMLSLLCYIKYLTI